MGTNDNIPGSFFTSTELFLNDLDFIDCLKEIHTNLIPTKLDSAQNLNVNAHTNSNILNNNVNSSTYTGVVYLSNHTLSDIELSLLSKGLTFVNTPPTTDIGILCEDLSKFHTSIKRKLAIV